MNSKMPANPVGDVPESLDNTETLDEVLSRPTPAALAALKTLDSDLVILGVSGKMGPTLARMAVRGLAQIGAPYRVYGVARFSQPEARRQLDAWGVETIACDLLNRNEVAALPNSNAVIFMAGQKFGTVGHSHLTWAINTYLPALACERYAHARFVAFSTGNVYPLTPVVLGGSREGDPAEPVGEYAMSCLGRERIVEYYARTSGLSAAIMRLNYAVELRYGVLVDIANRVYAGEPVDVGMGAVNVIWQGDANGQALGLLNHCASPPATFNITGPETVSVRRIAQQFGELLGKTPVFTGIENETALLSNAAKSVGVFGYPQISLDQMAAWIAHWVAQDGASLGKPTHFETRDGKF
jgi:nucleoside-diphosphate-sugar epimerase